MAEILPEGKRLRISVTVVVFIILTVAYCLFRILRAPAAVPWLRHTETTSAADAGAQDWREFRVTSLSPPNEPSYSGNYSAIAEIRQRKRQRLLAEMCAKYFPLGDAEEKLATTTVYKELGVVYCKNDKVATTSWRMALKEGIIGPRNSTDGREKRSFPNRIIRYGARKRERILNSSFKFMFVRHPFERLVSAWENKIFEKSYNSLDAKTYERVVRVIRRRYRTPGGRQGAPTFEEFVRFLTDQRTKNPFDRHWMPFYKQCRPCRVHYDFIGHLETIKEDAEYVLNKIGLRNITLFHRHPSRRNASSLVIKEIASLSPEQREKLIEIYRLDFLLFGYSTNYSNDSPTSLAFE